MSFVEGRFYLAPDVHPCADSFFLFHWNGPRHVATIAQIVQEDDLQA